MQSRLVVVGLSCVGLAQAHPKILLITTTLVIVFTVLVITTAPRKLNRGMCLDTSHPTSSLPSTLNEGSILTMYVHTYVHTCMSCSGMSICAHMHALMSPRRGARGRLVCVH